MKNLIIDERDQKFLLYDVFGIEKIFNTPQYHIYSRESFDMILSTALNLALNECYPVMREADKKGCRFENGNIYVPEAYHPLKIIFDKGGWSSLLLPQEYGGQGFSSLMYLSVCESFMHNVPFFQYTNRPLSTSDALARYGSSEQKNRYLKKITEGKWAGPIALTEADAGSDIGMISTKAVKQADGSYRITGTKNTITNGDSDLFENYIYIVGARVEGAPAGIGGISLFLVPKYHVNADGSAGERNDYSISGLDKKMGWHGLATCTAHFGENNNCYGELIGSENMGVFLIAGMLMNAQLNIGLFSTGIASAAYLHALEYARERVQGVNVMNPDSQPVPIIEHPDVKNMLMSIKSNVEGMRAFVYYCGFLTDLIKISQDKMEKKKLEGLRLLLTPVCTVFCSDTAFDVTREAMQVFGSAGYFQDYPMEQFMRDVKVASVYEGSNGIIALRMLTMNMGKDYKNVYYLLEEIDSTILQNQHNERLKDVSRDLQKKLEVLNRTVIFLNSCVSQNKPLIPIANASLLLKLIGLITTGWLLLRKAGIAEEKLTTLYNNRKILSEDKDDIALFIKENQEAGFYYSKILVARYYCKHYLPFADTISERIQNNSMITEEISNDVF